MSVLVNAQHACALDRTTRLIQKNCSHEELPGVMEKGLLHEVEGRPRGRPFLEGFSPGWAES